MTKHLTIESSVPLYKEVEREILECLSRGDWKPGDRLPSEPELAERFGVAVFTIRAGIQRLVDSGILLRRQGKGTFVALHRARPLRNQFLRIFNNDGAKANWDRDLVSIHKARAPDDVAAILKLGESAADRAVYELVFVLRKEGRVLAFLESSMSAKCFGTVTGDAFHDNGDNLYAVFQERFGVNVIRIEERVRAAKAGESGAHWLGIDAAEPVLHIERVAFTFNDVPVELRRYYVLAEDFYYFAAAGT